MHVNTLIEAYAKYNQSGKTSLIREAWGFAENAHKTQKPRADGSLYFTHPVAVSHILCDAKADLECICAGLLHDTIEDTDVEFEDISKKFGDEIATIIDGVTKLSKMEARNLSEQDYTAHNLRKFVAAIASDLRVLVVKLADRIHNMRTIAALHGEKRRRIAVETQDFYVPLARRAGLEDWANILQELVFETLNPEGHQAIKNALKANYQGQAHQVRERICQELTNDLNLYGIDAKVSGRMKAAYSIWLKMRARKVSFEQLSDVMAFRVVVDTEDQCYLAMGCLHRKYSVRPGRIKDYISLPRENGYQSIHTNLIGPYNENIEVQIRTQQMHKYAEYGLAAHWDYKEKNISSQLHQDSDFKRRWFKNFQEVLKNSANAELVLHHSRLELDQARMMTFTPKGDLIWLPPKSTPVDFAFAIHTELGMAIKSAKINGQIAPLSSEIQNGDQIEIISGEKAQPDLAWRHFVKTGKALSILNNYEEKMKKKVAISTGRQVVEQLASEVGYQMSDKAFKIASKGLNFSTVNMMLEKIGKTEVKPSDALLKAFPGALKKLNHQRDNPLVLALQNRTQNYKPNDNAVFANHSNSDSKKTDDKAFGAIILDHISSGTTMHMGKCCSPIPGDSIIGVPILGQGYRVHIKTCKQLDKFKSIADRWVRLAWSKKLTGMQIARLQIRLYNLPGALGEATSTIGREGSNITNLVFTARDQYFFTMDISLEVKDIEHLNDIISALMCGSSTQNVERLLD
ncbi:MAG: RelA/SpoT family protein [Pseudomonadota bacterium]